MNVYTGSAATLAVDLAQQGALPSWFSGGARARMRPLVALAATSTVMFVLLAVGAFSVDTLVRATSACFVAVYVLALAAAVRTLEAGGRVLAVVALAAVGVVAAFSSVYVLVPAVAALLVLVLRRRDRPALVA
jgi:amino acid efflux transporter